MYYVTLTKPDGTLEELFGYSDLMEVYAKMPLLMKTYSPKVLTVIYREVH